MIWTLLLGAYMGGGLLAASLVKWQPWQSLAFNVANKIVTGVFWLPFMILVLLTS